MSNQEIKTNSEVTNSDETDKNNVADYEKKLPEISAISEDDIVKSSNIPISIYIQEAQNLYIWCQLDKELLKAKGLNWAIVEDIPVCCGALREAESRWITQRFTVAEKIKLWKERSDIAYKLRKFIIHEFRFAYRKNDYLLDRPCSKRSFGGYN